METEGAAEYNHTRMITNTVTATVYPQQSTQACVGTSTHVLLLQLCNLSQADPAAHTPLPTVCNLQNHVKQL
jgi:hypothetical protein